MNCPRRSVDKHAHVCFLFTPSYVMYVLRPCEIDTDYGKGRRLYYILFGEWLRVLGSVMPPDTLLQVTHSLITDWTHRWIDISCVFCFPYILYIRQTRWFHSQYLLHMSVKGYFQLTVLIERSFLAHQIGISDVLTYVRYFYLTSPYQP